MKPCCCSAPNSQNNLRWTLFFLVIITYITWAIALFHCSFIEIEIDNIRVAFGPIRRATHHTEDQGNILGCRAYTSYEYDTFFDSAQVVGHWVGMVGFGLHSILLTFVTASCFFLKRMAKYLWATSKVLVILSFACSIALFSFGYIEECFQDPSVQCTPGISGMVALGNAALMLIVLVISVLTDSPPHPLFFVRFWNDKEDNKKNRKKSNNTGNTSDKATTASSGSSQEEPDSDPEQEKEQGTELAYDISKITEEKGMDFEESRFDPFRLSRRAVKEEEKSEVEPPVDYGGVLFERSEEGPDGKERVIKEYLEPDGSISIVRSAWMEAV